jgi:hypothetical protein
MQSNRLEGFCLADEMMSCSSSTCEGGSNKEKERAREGDWERTRKQEKAIWKENQGGHILVPCTHSTAPHAFSDTRSQSPTSPAVSSWFLEALRSPWSVAYFPPSVQSA